MLARGALLVARVLHRDGLVFGFCPRRSASCTNLHLSPWRHHPRRQNEQCPRHGRTPGEVGTPPRQGSVWARAGGFGAADAGRIVVLGPWPGPGPWPVLGLGLGLWLGLGLGRDGRAFVGEAGGGFVRRLARAPRMVNLAADGFGGRPRERAGSEARVDESPAVGVPTRPRARARLPLHARARRVSTLVVASGIRAVEAASREALGEAARSGACEWGFHRGVPAVLVVRQLRRVPEAGCTRARSDAGRRRRGRCVVMRSTRSVRVRGRKGRVARVVVSGVRRRVLVQAKRIAPTLAGRATTTRTGSRRTRASSTNPRAAFRTNSPEPRGHPPARRRCARRATTLSAVVAFGVRWEANSKTHREKYPCHAQLCPRVAREAAPAHARARWATCPPPAPGAFARPASRPCASIPPSERADHAVMLTNDEASTSKLACVERGYLRDDFVHRFAARSKYSLSSIAGTTPACWRCVASSTPSSPSPDERSRRRFQTRAATRSSASAPVSTPPGSASAPRARAARYIEVDHAPVVAKKVAIVNEADDMRALCVGGAGLAPLERLAEPESTAATNRRPRPPTSRSATRGDTASSPPISAMSPPSTPPCAPRVSTRPFPPSSSPSVASRTSRMTTPPP